MDFFPWAAPVTAHEFCSPYFVDKVRLCRVFYLCLSFWEVIEHWNYCQTDLVYLYLISYVRLSSDAVIDYKSLTLNCLLTFIWWNTKYWKQEVRIRVQPYPQKRKAELGMQKVLLTPELSTTSILNKSHLSGWVSCNDLY